MEHKHLPKKIISIYSSTLINLCELCSNDIELINLEIEELFNYHVGDVDFKKYESYFKKNKKINNLEFKI